MSDHDLLDPTSGADHRIDARARAAGADLRRPAPANGFNRVQRVRRTQLVVRAVGGGAGALLLIGGGALVLRNNSGTPIVLTSPSVAEDSSTTDPTTLITTAATPAPVPEPPPSVEPAAIGSLGGVSNDTSYFMVDNTTNTATEMTIGGDTVRTFPIRLTTGRPQPMSSDAVVGLGTDLAGPPADFADNVAICQNLPLMKRTAQGATAPLHPEMYEARLVAASPGLIVAVRAACPTGATFLDPGTAWELVMWQPGIDDTPIVLDRGDAQLACDGCDFDPNVPRSSNFPSSVSVVGDGGWVTMSTYQDGQNELRVYSTADRSRLDLAGRGCQPFGQPAAIDAEAVAVVCMRWPDLPKVEVHSRTGVVWAATTPESSFAPILSMHVSNGDGVVVLASAIRPPDSRTAWIQMFTETGSVAPTLPNDLPGVAAWSLADVGYEEAI
jgi:hypothetical protein